MTGAEMDARIMRILEDIPGAIIAYHHPDSRRATVKGFPDWVFIGARILFREVKGDDDTLSADQRYIGKMINLTDDGDWAVWRPRDVLPGGTAEKSLRSIADYSEPSRSSH